MSRPGSYTYLDSLEWDRRIDALASHMHCCTLCPRACRADRLSGERGFCDAPAQMIISSIFSHHGEEPPISGSAGSGTVFFSHCTLRCAFCQNFQISHEHVGSTYQVQELAAQMLHLQELGCHNVNLVTATHFLPWVVRSIREASQSGLSIPIVYNCGGYESVDTIKHLSGIVDIYLPDMKYGSNEAAALYSRAPDYVEVNHQAIREMFRQVGPLRTDSDGIASRGLCIRHLVLPNGQSHSENVLRFLSSTFDPQDISISLMAQYRPLYKASNYPLIHDGIEPLYYGTLMEQFQQEGFGGFYQEVSAMDRAFLIDFRKRKDQALTGDTVDWDL